MQREDSFSVLTYNLRMLADQYDTRGRRGLDPKPEWALRSTGELIRRSNADVVANQEVENRGIYDKFRVKYVNAGHPHAALVDGNDPAGLDVATMSRYPIQKVVTHGSEQFPLEPGKPRMTHFSRDLLRTDILIGNETVTVYNTHSIAQRNDWDGFDTKQRLAEAKAIRDIVMEEMAQFPGRLYMIVGDLNADLDEESLQELLNGPGEKLVDTLAGLPDGKRHTWPADPRRSHGHDPVQFDHILIPESQRHRLIRSEVLNSDNPGSDHKAVRAEFRKAK